MAENKPYSINLHDLVLRPMTVAQLQQAPANGEIPYAERLNRIAEHPESGLWNTIWQVVRKENKKKEISEAVVGGFYFDGPEDHGNLVLHFWIDKEYRENGYGIEVVRGISDWALSQKNVYQIITSADAEDYTWNHLLERADYVVRVSNKKINYYSVLRPKTAWLGVYVAIGIIFGIGLGLAIGSAWIGLIVSMVLAISLGIAMDARDRAKRKQIVASYSYFKQYEEEVDAEGHDFDKDKISL